MPDDLDDELLAQMREDFLAESQDIFTRLGTQLAQLEKEQPPDLVHTIFREVHTIKGTAGFVGLNAMRRLAHKLEDVFGAVRADKLPVTPELVDLAFVGLQHFTDMREDVARGGDGETDIDALVLKLDSALRGELPTAPVAAPSASLPIAPPVPSVDLTPSVSPPPRQPPPSDSISARADSVKPPADSQPEPRAETPATESTLRVDVETLDNFMVLVGELITARNALAASADRLRDETLTENLAALTRLTRQLQMAATTVRLIPVERLFTRFTPIVRNLARERGKQVRLVITGGDTPMDRVVSEQMYDPLIHMIRNAIDHGLESAADRLRLGKPEEGTLQLSAERRGDDILIRIADDGQGLDPARLRRAVVDKGLLPAAEAAALTDDQARRLIFLPGFSTASAVTDLSGRGVGMDVVLQNVRRLRGSIEIESTLGQGTTFIIQLPLTLAILQVLLVRESQHLYALPLHAVRETLQLDPLAIQTMQQGEVTFIREAALPLRRLGQLLRRETLLTSVTEVKPAVVVRAASGEQVLMVDELLGKHQMVIKPLSPYLGAVSGVEGAAILPDGSVTLIVDVDGLLHDF